MSKPEDIRPPANYLDPAIKAMVYIAGGLLTLAVIGNGVAIRSEKEAPQNDTNTQSSRPGNEMIVAAARPAISQAPRPDVESNPGVEDYVVPLGIVTAEVVGIAYLLNERRKRRHPFNQPFTPPAEELYPINEAEANAFEAIRQHLE